MGRNRKLESLDDFQRALKQKYGLGEGDEYTPWIRVQDVKSHGNSAKIDGLKANRTHHTLSEHESCFFYLAEFSESVIDIREQFPLLPLDISIKIAQTLGVDHPINPKSRDRSVNIMTTDFILTRTCGFKIWYEAVSVKPAAELRDKRIAEKLEIERLWWQLQGIPFHIFVMTEQNKIQSRNIQWFTSPLRHGVSFPDDLMEQAKAHICFGTVMIEVLCNTLVLELGMEQEDALLLFKVLLATKQVVVDLDMPIADTGIAEVLQVNRQEMEHYHAS
ncbi:transposase [Shewanella algae]|uniref:TnsA endonuclease N-terminal domain-containing protein n=1 Tax=Shewanella algae TaxID=38313 RepID=UPI001183C3D3|nr:TnsA endonuclease N-terminal domain-containing protein [Shewanella algae]TVK96680.1 transposase [Shewanella algae]TVK97538.1 transposase [Shewanella algae]HDS1209271.1 TnsA endonuclease N-terminal domain-containing protein [Shewanella algae]